MRSLNQIRLVGLGVQPARTRIGADANASTKAGDAIDWWGETKGALGIENWTAWAMLFGIPIASGVVGAVIGGKNHRWSGAAVGGAIGTVGTLIAAGR